METIPITLEAATVAQRGERKGRERKGGRGGTRGWRGNTSVYYAFPTTVVVLLLSEMTEQCGP